LLLVCTASTDKLTLGCGNVYTESLGHL
jgi:hypothetical protein